MCRLAVERAAATGPQFITLQNTHARRTCILVGLGVPLLLQLGIQAVGCWLLQEEAKEGAVEQRRSAAGAAGGPPGRARQARSLIDFCLNTSVRPERLESGGGVWPERPTQAEARPARSPA